MSPYLAAPGFHNLTPVCGDGYVSVLGVLNFYYCAFNFDSLISSGVGMAVTLVIALAIAYRVSHGVPGKLQLVLEFLVSYSQGLVRDTVSASATFVVPLAATLGLFILLANWLDFFPLAGPVQPANSMLNQTLAMAIVVFVLVEAYSIREQGVVGFLKRFTRSPSFLAPLWVLEEVVKPVTLSLRLFGNIFAGVLMVFLIGLLFTFGVTGDSFAAHIWAPLGLIFLILWKAFDVFFVGTIQAFIFMLLTIIYFGMAREGMEEHEGAHAH